METRLDDYIGLDDQIMSTTSKFMFELLLKNLNESQIESLKKARNIIENLHNRKIYKLKRKTIIKHQPKMTRIKAQRK